VASRKEQKEQARQERLAKEQAAASAAQRKKLVGYVVGGVLVVAIVAVLVVVVAGGGGGGEAKVGKGNGAEVSYPSSPKAPPAGSVADLAANAKAAHCQLLNPPNEGNTHVTTPVKYKANPPTSGNHNPVPADDGLYKKAPQIEHTVHTMEHGRIDIQFAPTAPPDVRAKLKSVFDEDPYHMLLFPNQTKMPYQVAATTWNHSLVCKTANDKVYDAIRAFKGKYRDKGPEFIP
jgi:hypothetical protein